MFLEIAGHVINADHIVDLNPGGGLSLMSANVVTVPPDELPDFHGKLIQAGFAEINGHAVNPDHITELSPSGGISLGNGNSIAIPFKDFGPLRGKLLDEAKAKEKAKK